MITPSNEFRTGGPVKQDLTSHAGPVTLSVSSPIGFCYYQKYNYNEYSYQWVGSWLCCKCAKREPT
jgi:hypothetical protein